MTVVRVRHNNWEEREAKIAEYVGLGYILLYDDFTDWKRGRGTLTFTDAIPAPTAEPRPGIYWVLCSEHPSEGSI